MAHTTHTTHTTERQLSSRRNVTGIGRQLAAWYRSGVGIVITLSTVAGVWGVLCLAAGLSAEAGDLGRGLVTALTGL
ncbi:MAG: hypothetical protein AB1634_17555 [Thermodesulfobacteriota bacterium]